MEKSQQEPLKTTSSTLKMSVSKEDASVTISDKTLTSFLSRRTSETIVDLMLKIMDSEGPRPMRNFKPAQKTSNGADLFYEEHQGEYEARAQPGRDKIVTVHAHNRAYPRMYDELEKRRSIAQPVAFNIANQNMESNTSKLKKQAGRGAHRKRMHKKTKHHRSSRTKSKLRRLKTKLTKHRQPVRRYRTRSMFKIRMNNGCQFKTHHDSAKTTNVSSKNDNSRKEGSESSQMDVQEVTSPALSILDNTEKFQSRNVIAPPNTSDVNQIRSKSDIESAKPETISRSISSYNSYMSMEHEPMLE